MKYLITEKQNLQSIRGGEQIEAKSLRDAKRRATREKSFLGTVLTIESADGEHLLAFKKDGKWHDCID